MFIRPSIVWVGAALLLLGASAMPGSASASGAEPVFAASDTLTLATPNPSPEAVTLLEYLYNISGTHTLTGQHCPPLLGSTRLSVVHRMTQTYPAVFGQDFGFSYPGYWDGINYRQRIIDDAILRHRDWFWWGKKGGDDGYQKLRRMLFDRLVHFHKLNNLIWVYNTNEVKDGADPHETYFPGHDVVDVLATDVYSEGFNQMNYDTLLELAGDKPVALGKVGALPPAEKLQEQPRWTWFMQWGDPGGNNRESFQAFFGTYRSDAALTLDDLPWVTTSDVTLHYPFLK